MCPPDGTNCNSSKVGHQVAPLVLPHCLGSLYILSVDIETYQLSVTKVLCVDPKEKMALRVIFPASSHSLVVATLGKLAEGSFQSSQVETPLGQPTRHSA